MLENNKGKINKWLVFTLSIVPIWVSIVSTIHVITFFELTNSLLMSIIIALSFEVGALAALASLVIIDKINKNVVYFIFFILTIYQCMGNTYHAFDQLSNHMKENPYWIQNFIDLFGLGDSELPFTKRLLAIISGAIFPIVSLCFLDILINYVMVSLGMKESKRKKDEPPIIERVDKSTIDQVNTEYGIANVLDPAVSDEVKNLITPEIENEGVSEGVSEGVNTNPIPNTEDKKYPWESNEETTQESPPDITPAIPKEGISLGKGSRHNVSYVKE